MKTVDKHLEDAAQEVRRQLLQIPDRQPTPLFVAARRRRTAKLVGTLLLGATLSVGSFALLSGREPPAPGSGGAPSSTAAPSGEITFAQYEAAYTAYVECLRGAGLSVQGPLRFGRDSEAGLELELGGERGIDPTIFLQRNVVVDGVDETHLNAVDASCHETHLGEIEDRWIEQESTKFLSMREWIDNLLACATAKGMSIPESLSYEEMLNDVGGDPSDQLFIDLAAEAIVEHGCRPWER